MRFVTSLIAALGFANAEVIIHDRYIGKQIEKFGGWVEREANSDSFGELARALGTANEKAKIENMHANYRIMAKVQDIASEFVNGTKHFIGQNCSAEAYASCMARHDGPGDYMHGYSNWGRQWMHHDHTCWI